MDGIFSSFSFLLLTATMIQAIHTVGLWMFKMIPLYPVKVSDDLTILYE